MSQSPDITCDACKMAPFPADAPRDAATGLPQSWVVRRINGRTYTLCDCCGSIRHFKGGISSYLQESLGVPEYAQCDFGEEEGGGLHRSRLRR
ncbi:MAG: hypothetical protein AB7U75_18815 [Hyphomicrobiaceae bacterium]